MICISAQSIGVAALKSIQRNPSAGVYGVTSKGVFIKMPDATIVFISWDGFRNPLTVNLPAAKSYFQVLKHADPIEIYSGDLIFPTVGVHIEVDSANLWSARANETVLDQLPVPLTITHFLSRLRNRLQQPVEFFEAALTLIGIIHFELPDELHSALLPLVAPDSTHLEALATAGVFLAGRGHGLTPSGDDVLLGWCYALERLTGFHNLDLHALHAMMIGLVSQRSTLISAGLIAAAAQRELDERLLYAFEAMTGAIPFDKSILEDVIQWGSSSGVEAVAGMAMGLSAVYRSNNLSLVPMDSA